MEEGEVERAHGHVAQHGRYVAIRDAQREALDHRRLADARLADQDRIVLPPAQENVDHLPDLEIATEDLIDLSLFRALGEVDRIRVEVRRLSLPGARGVRRSRGVRTLGQGLLARAGRNGGEVLPKRLHGNLRELAADVLHHSREIVIGEERKHRMAGAHLRRAVVDRAERPRLGEHARKVRADRGRACISRLEMVETLGEVGGEPRPIQRVVLHDEREVGVGDVEQFDEEMLDLDVVVRAREAKSSRAFEGATRGGVQLTDEGAQVDGHGGWWLV